MAIGLICINCGAKIKVPESAAGKKGKCPKCKEIIRIFETSSLSGHLCDQCGKPLANEQNYHRVTDKLYCNLCFIKHQRGKIKKGTEAVKPFDFSAGEESDVPKRKEGTRILGKGQRMADKFLIQLLNEQGVLKESDIDPMLKYQKVLGKRLIPLIRDINLISEEGIAKAITETTGFVQCPPGELEIPDELLDLLDEGIINKYDAVPLKREEKKVTLAFPNPLDIGGVQNIGRKLGMRVIPMVCTWSQYKGARIRLRKLAGNESSKK